MSRLVPLLIAVAVLAACHEPPPMELVELPPPEGWESYLEESRARKDRYFRTSAESPVAEPAGFERLDYYPPDPSLYRVGPLQRHPRPARVEIVTTTGEVRPAERYGQITFEAGGREHTLQVYRLLDGGADGENLFLPFMDETSGEETYFAGRYLELDGPPGGPYVVDFNQAYNPWCAYGAPDRYACPVTPPENRLDLRIGAGERGWIDPAGGHGAPAG